MKKDAGMGLLIAKKLVEGMDGTLRLLPSQPDRGPIFAIRLKLAGDIQEQNNDTN